VLRAVSGAGGCGNCHSHQSCTEHCPVDIDPARAVAGLKRAALTAFLKGGAR
jgi:fumarate reductase iron-sulfur subunit